MHLTKRFSIILCTGVLFLMACVGTTPQTVPQSDPQPTSQTVLQTAPKKDSSESSVASDKNTEAFAPVAPANEPMTLETEPMAPETKPMALANAVPDIYVEIPRLAKRR